MLWVGAPVIGVAKQVFRGQRSKCCAAEGRRPLRDRCWLFGDGGSQLHFGTMHGAHRAPTLLKLADHTCRTYISDTRRHHA
jgi:deoxyinosine 3'endonuclease (endonuclease V)